MEPGARKIIEQLDAVITSSGREALLDLLAVLTDRAAFIRGKLAEPQHVARRDRAVTMPKAARRLSVSDDTLRAMVKAGRIRHVVVGEGDVRIPLSAVEEFLSGGKAEGR